MSYAESVNELILLNIWLIWGTKSLFEELASSWNRLDDKNVRL
jgi:hypothetical protein